MRVILLTLMLSGCSLIPQVALNTQSADESIETLTQARDARVEPVSPQPRITIDTETVMAQSAQTGPQFDLNVEDVDAHAFFRSLVYDTPFNIVVHPEVTGRISLQLTSVTVPEVMVVMRDVYGYDFVLSGSVYQVYPDALRTEIFRLNYLNLAREILQKNGLTKIKDEDKYIRM